MFVHRRRTGYGFLYSFLQPEKTEKWGKVGENLADAVTTFAKNPGPLYSQTYKPVLRVWAHHFGKQNTVMALPIG